MRETTPYSIPKEPGRWRAIILAALVHALLFGFFWIGIRWQNEQPVAVEAEVWDMQAKQAAPSPEPKPEPEVKPEPAPPVKQAPPPKEIEEKPVPNPDIVLEQEKKRKAEEANKRQHEEEQAKQKKLAEERRLEEEKQKKAKEEQDRIDREQLKKQAAEKKKAEEEKKKREAEELARLEKLRKENLERMLGSAIGTGGVGEAPKSQGNNRANADYIQRIASKIKSNIAFIVPNDLAGNPPVEFEVRLLPDGSVAGMRKLKSSGVPGFDEAVARAIERSQPYPKDNSGLVPSSFTGIHRPKDQ